MPEPVWRSLACPDKRADSRHGLSKSKISDFPLRAIPAGKVLRQTSLRELRPTSSISLGVRRFRSGGIPGANATFRSVEPNRACAAPEKRSRSVSNVDLARIPRFEAQLPSDTRRIGEKVMPGLTTRSVTVQILRTVPELWLAPLPGSSVELVAGTARDEALFVDQMPQRLAIGLDAHDRPIFADIRVMSGERGGHVSISGVSGVAAKTSYALFLLYVLLESPGGTALLGAARPQTHALVFNVKGEDLLHVDRPNIAYDAEREDASWASMRRGRFATLSFSCPDRPRRPMIRCYRSNFATAVRCDGVRLDARAVRKAAVVAVLLRR